MVHIRELVDFLKKQLRYDFIDRPVNAAEVETYTGRDINRYGIGKKAE